MLDVFISLWSISQFSQKSKTASREMIEAVGAKIKLSRAPSNERLSNIDLVANMQISVLSIDSK